MQFELTKDFIDQIIVSIERNENEFLIDKLHSLHPVDIAEVMRVVNLLKHNTFLDFWRGVVFRCFS